MPHRQLRLSLAGLVCLVLIALFVGWLFNLPTPANERPDFGARLQAWVAEAEVGDTADLAELLSTKFDRVAIIAPYADNPAVERALGIPWNAEGTPAYHGGSEVVLLSGKSVIAWFALDRMVLDGVVVENDLGRGTVVLDGSVVVERTGGVMFREATEP